MSERKSIWRPYCKGSPSACDAQDRCIGGQFGVRYDPPCLHDAAPPAAPAPDVQCENVKHGFPPCPGLPGGCDTSGPAAPAPDLWDDVRWLHKFINCVPFGADAPIDDIERAHRIVDALMSQEK